MKVKIALIVAAVSLALAGCTGNGNEAHSVGTTAPLAEKPAAANGFALTAEEQDVYSRYQETLDNTHLSGLAPLSVAKLYVQARLDQHYDVAYALYTTKTGFVQWSKEEDENIPDAHRGTPDQIRQSFRNIEAGTFIQTSDFQGYIAYHPGNDSAEASGFQLVKDDDGTWKVAFLPLQ